MHLPHFWTTFCFFFAWLLLLLVTLSNPIIKSIELFTLHAALHYGTSLVGVSANAVVRFGVFGWCSSQVDAGAFSFQAHQAAQCSPRKLGYTIDPTLERILSSINADDLVDVIQKGLTVVLVLHPIACGLAGLAFIFAAWAMLSSKSGRLPSTLATVNGFIAATLTTIVFIIDCVLVGIARSRIRSKTSGLATISYGNAVWMTLVAAIVLWLGVVGACFGVVRSRKERNAVKY